MIKTHLEVVVQLFACLPNSYDGFMWGTEQKQAWQSFLRFHKRRVNVWFVNKLFLSLMICWFRPQNHSEWFVHESGWSSSWVQLTDPLIHWSLIHWFTDPQIHWFTDPQIHWFTDSPIHWFTDSPIHWSTDSPIHRSTDSPIHRSTDPPIHRSTDPQIHWFTESPIHRSTDSPIHRFTDSPIHRSTDSPIHRSTDSPIHRSTDPQRKELRMKIRV